MQGDNPSEFFGGGLYIVSDGETTFIDDSNFKSVPFLGSPAINNEGTIAISSNRGPGVDTGLYTVSDGEVSLIADSSGSFDSFGSTGINDASTVAFAAELDAGGSGIFTISDGATTTIADESGPFDFLLGGTAINNAGTVAFGAFPNFDDFLGGNGGGGIFTNSGGATTLIADNTGPFATFGPPAINDSGTVAFQATLDAEGVGIFTGPDPVTDKVIATGDTLFGSTVTSLSFARFDNKGLNNSGQLAFFAELEDGTSGIFRADPVMLG